MASPKVKLKMFYRAKYEERKEDQHARFAENLSKIGEPFCFDIGPCPKFGYDDPLVGYHSKHKTIKGLRFGGNYYFKWEGNKERYYGVFGIDETFYIEFNTSNKNLNYQNILHEQYPKIIEAYMPYKGVLYFGSYFCQYTDNAEKYDPEYKKLDANPAIKIDWRNNIYTLHPAQFWDKQLCDLALGYGPDEVIKRLCGQVFNGAPIPLVKALLDGVYIVLNDDPKLDYETFIAMNKHYKAILGLV